MGFEQVTWSPRVGASGDDLWNVPGAEKLDGSFDTGAPSLIKPGDSSGFSSTPTIAEINASSDFNQVIGLLNRRIKRYNTLFGTAMVAQNYFPITPKYRAADVAAIQTKINTLRAKEGFANFSFTAGVASKAKMKGVHLSELRKSLGIYGVQKIVWSHAVIFVRRDNPMGTLIAEALGGATHLEYGKYHIDASNNPLRQRQLLSFPIPDWADATYIVSSKYWAGMSSVTQTIESINWELYSSNSDDHAYGSTPLAYNLDNLEYSVAAANGDVEADIDATRLAARAATYLSLIIGADTELAGSGGSGSAGQKASFNSALHSSEAALHVQIDWGT